MSRRGLPRKIPYIQPIDREPSTIPHPTVRLDWVHLQAVVFQASWVLFHKEVDSGGLYHGAWPK